MLRFVKGKLKGNRYFTDTLLEPYLGVYGDGDKIYIFEQYMNHKKFHRDHPPMKGPLKTKNECNYRPPYFHPSGPHTGDYITRNSVPIYYASLYAKKIVLDYIGEEIGIRVPIILDESFEEKKYGHADISFIKYRGGRVSDAKGELIRVNPYSINFKRGNYFDIYLNLIHEKHHIDTPEDFMDEPQSELEAYDAVISHHLFKYASGDFQKHIYKRYDDYKIEYDRTPRTTKYFGNR